MRDGQKVTFRGEGDQEPNIEPGDVILVLQQKDHDTFTREGSDLYVSKTVGLTEALCGFEMVLKHLDQRDLVLRYPAGNIIEPGCIRGVVGEGMPTYKRPFDKGNLYVKFEIEFPENNFLPLDKLLQLEELLPSRPPSVQAMEDVEEVDLVELDPRYQENQRKEAYENGSDDETGGPRVQCAHQ